MFKTAIRDQDNPQRPIRTSCPINSKRIRLHLKKPLGREQEFVERDTYRPFTSQLKTPKAYQTLNLTGKSDNLVNMSTINVVENQLQSEYKQQMCGYLKKKLRQIVGKRQEDMLESRYLNSTIQNVEFEQTNNSSLGPLDKLYSTLSQKSRIKKQKGIDGAYVSNAKEHIVRMIHRRRETISDYQEVNNSIKTRREENQQKRSRSLKDHFKCPNVQRQNWDLEWKESINQEKKRYKNRLIMKCNRQNNNQWLSAFHQ